MGANYKDEIVDGHYERALQQARSFLEERRMKLRQEMMQYRLRTEIDIRLCIERAIFQSRMQFHERVYHAKKRLRDVIVELEERYKYSDIKEYIDKEFGRIDENGENEGKTLDKNGNDINRKANRTSRYIEEENGLSKQGIENDRHRSNIDLFDYSKEQLMGQIQFDGLGSKNQDLDKRNLRQSELDKLDTNYQSQKSFRKTRTERDKNVLKKGQFEWGKAQPMEQRRFDGLESENLDSDQEYFKLIGLNIKRRSDQNQAQDRLSNKRTEQDKNGLIMDLVEGDKRQSIEHRLLDGSESNKIENLKRIDFNNEDGTYQNKPRAAEVHDKINPKFLERSFNEDAQVENPFSSSEESEKNPFDYEFGGVVDMGVKEAGQNNESCNSKGSNERCVSKAKKNAKSNENKRLSKKLGLTDGEKSRNTTLKIRESRSGFEQGDDSDSDESLGISVLEDSDHRLSNLVEKTIKIQGRNQASELRNGHKTSGEVNDCIDQTDIKHLGRNCYEKGFYYDGMDIQGSFNRIENHVNDDDDDDDGVLADDDDDHEEIRNDGYDDNDDDDDGDDDYHDEIRNDDDDDEEGPEIQTYDILGAFSPRGPVRYGKLKAERQRKRSYGTKTKVYKNTLQGNTLSLPKPPVGSPLLQDVDDLWVITPMSPWVEFSPLVADFDKNAGLDIQQTAKGTNKFIFPNDEKICEISDENNEISKNEGSEKRTVNETDKNTMYGNVTKSYENDNGINKEKKENSKVKIQMKKKTTKKSRIPVQINQKKSRIPVRINQTKTMINYAVS